MMMTRLEKNEKHSTHKMANLRGLKESTGINTKHRTKQASAPRLHPANTSSRSHLLTVAHVSYPASEILRMNSATVDAFLNIIWSGFMG